MTTSSQAAESLSGSCLNFLSIEDSYFKTTTGSWETTNGTPSVDFSFRFNTEYNTLKVTPVSSNPITLEHSEVQFSREYRNDFITFFASVYCESKVTAIVTITSSFGETSSVTTVLNALTWGIIRGPQIQIPDTQGNIGFTTSIQILNHNQTPIYFAHPVLTNVYAIRNNLFLRMCIQRMPAFLIEKDSEQTFPSYPLLRLMDVGLAYAGKGVDQLDTFPYLDIASGYDPTDTTTQSALVEPQVADKEFLAWVAQIVGVKLNESGGGSTPWGNLPRTWASFVSLIDDNDGNATADWDEIESFNTTDFNFIQGRRDHITTARTGHNAGTKTAIIDSAQTVLTGTESVNYIVDPIANPWTITLETLTSETPGGIFGEDSETIINEVEGSRPMGFTIQHICKDSFTPITYFEVAPLSQETTLDWALTSGGYEPNPGNVEAGANRDINSTALQSDGSIVVGGVFTTTNNVTTNRVALLDSSGALNATFATNIGTGANDQVFEVRVQSDDKIIICGQFTSFNGTTTNRVARLSSTGIIDTTFSTNLGTGFSGSVNDLAIQSDGKIVAGGQFTTLNGVTVNRIARLNSNGSPDTAFTTNTGAGAFGEVYDIVIQSSDQKILIGGIFTAFNSVSVGRIVRLNTDGTRDTTFTTNNGTGANNSIGALAVQTDGKIIVGGSFTSWNGTTTTRIARLNSDGTLDTTFTTNTGTGANSTVQSIAIQSDGKIVIGGVFTTFDGTDTRGLARLNSDGLLDTAFDTVIDFGTNDATTVAQVSTIAIQSDGKIVIGGIFTNFNYTPADKLARLNIDGSLDTAFMVSNAGGITAADGTAIGTGAQNTLDIIADTGGVAATNAAAYCADLVYGGYSDWFLPSKDELAQLRIQRTAIGDLQIYEYWSSTEFYNATSYAWNQRIETGAAWGYSKTQATLVRPVRSFTSYRSYAIGSTGPAGGKIFIVQP